MRINTELNVLDYEGNPVLEKNSQEPITIKDVFLTSLNATLGNEMIPAETKNRIYQISIKIYDKKEADFTPEQLTLIKERVGLIYSPMIYGYICEIIDGNGTPPARKASEDGKQNSAN